MTVPTTPPCSAEIKAMSGPSIASPLARISLSALAMIGAMLLSSASASAAAPAMADPHYPFEGTWIRADRVCTPKAPLVRTYTTREVISSRSRCVIRRVVGGTGSFDLVEECRHNDRPMTVTESIRMLSPDMMSLKRHELRLKIPRAVRFARCNAAPPATGPNRPH